MAKFNSSQFKSQIRNLQNKLNQQINTYNRAVNNYNQEVKKSINNYNNAARQYNQAVKQHNAKVLQNRAKIQSELRRLNSSQSKIIIKTTYSSSVTTLNNAYNIIAQKYDLQEQLSPFIEKFYSAVEQENENNLVAANIILDNAEQNEKDYSLQDTIIMDKLSKISNDLDNRWKGAIYSLSPKNPDATRHFCTSAREIFTEIFDVKANDAEVFSVFPNCEKTDRGNTTRRSKIKYFFKIKGVEDEKACDFVQTDIDNILELFHTLSDGTHGVAGRYTIGQLQAIKKRVEDGLIFLCDIAS